MTWRQFSFYYNKSLEKRNSKRHFTFQKQTTVETDYELVSAYHTDARIIKWAL